MMIKFNISAIKECNMDWKDAVVKEFTANNYDIPSGDIFDPLVQKLIAKRCEDCSINMLFELEKPGKSDIKYVLFTKEGARLYFTTKCEEGPLVMLKCREIKTFRCKSYDDIKYITYLAIDDDDIYLFNTYGQDDDNLLNLADVPIDRYEKITGLAGYVLNDIKSDKHPFLLDKLKSTVLIGSSYNSEYADHLSELYLLGAKGMLEDIVEWYFENGNEEDGDYNEDLALCFSALYSSNLVRGLEDGKAYQIAADSLSFCLGKKINPSEIDYDSECSSTTLSWGLDAVIGDNNAKDAETCKKLLVGYNELYQLEGYKECYSQLFAFSRVLSTRSFPEQMLLDCYEKVFDTDGRDNEEISKVLDLYK